MKKRTTENGSKNNDWETPEYIWDFLMGRFFQTQPFDPCPLRADFDGLAMDWPDHTYVNPPYTPRSAKEAFIRKAFYESQKGKHVVMLIPASTETKVFHEFIAPYAKVFLLEKRVKFKGHNTKGEYVTNQTGQGGSMLVEFGGGGQPCILPLSYQEVMGVSHEN